MAGRRTGAKPKEASDTMKSIETPTLSTPVVRWLPVWALLACGAAPAPAEGIVGGMEAEAGAWPWQVALIHPQGSGSEPFCGGSVIHPRWVLTAAACVDGVDADEVQVLAGTHDLDEGGRRIDVEAIRMHRGYVDSFGSGNDIALLELAGPAEVGEAVVLPDASLSAEVAEPGVMATAIGWGLTRPLRCEPGSKAGAHGCRPGGGGDGHFVDDLTGRPVDPSDVTTTRLMQVELPLVGERACLDAYHAYPGATIDHRTLCAGFREGGKDACEGDAGGPLVVRDEGEWVQVGVLSWGEGCAKPGKYGVYTNVGAFAEWVNETTGRKLVVEGPRHNYVGVPAEADETTERKLVVERGADANARASDGGTPLHVAVRNDSHDVAKLLIEGGADVNAEQEIGWAPLHVAALKNSLDVAKLLIEHGADVNAKASDGGTPLHIAARDGSHDVAKLLIEGGADVNAAQEIGWTPLHSAAWKNSLDVAKLLIGHGADVNAKASVGGTPLHVAARYDSHDVAMLLIDRGADVNARRNGGDTRLDESSLSGSGGEEMLAASLRLPPNRWEARHRVRGLPADSG